MPERKKYKKTLAHIKILLNCIVNVDPENDNIFYVEANLGVNEI